MKKLVLALLLIIVSLAAAQERDLFQEADDRFNFLIANDLGRNGYYDQKPVAAKMGEVGEKVDIEFVALLGDAHHFNGVASVQDPLWLTNFELIYDHPELMCEWYPVLGNHDYRGNTQAVLDYGKVSRRWAMAGRYYTKVFAVDDSGATLRLVFIDTPTLIDKYINNHEEYPDAGKQDLQRQLAWIDSVLTVNTATWTMVMGHHPVYAQTTKTENERLDMQQRLDPLLRRHNVDIYICGHIHSHQHIRRADSPVDYIVNSSAAEFRKVSPIEGTQFCAAASGFSVCSVTAADLRVYIMDKEGKVLHVVERKK